VLGIVVYLAIYLIMNIGTFACILCMCQEGRMVERIEDLKGLGRSNPLMALALTILMFSMAGIPPLAGFFGKYFVFLAAIKAGLYTLAVIGVLASVVGAFYYVRIVKLMYFEEPTEALDRPVGAVLRWMITGTSMAMVLFLLAAGPVVGGAEAAAAALFAG
jgi:NADH-quinone oxidoreductase subunit N